MPNFLGNLFKTKSREEKVRQWELKNGQRYDYDEDPLDLFHISHKLGSSIRYGGKTRKHKKSRKSRKSKKSRKCRKSRKSRK